MTQDVKMFCYQCEQTAQGKGCSVHGVCGKDSKVADLHDILVYLCKGIGQYGHRAALMGKRDNKVNRFILDAFFSTLTNVNFDPERFVGYIHQAVQMRDKARQMYEQACKEAGKKPEQLDGPATFQPAGSEDELLEQWHQASNIADRLNSLGEDVTGLEELSIYGLKGMAAYADHAATLGVEDDEVYDFYHETLDWLSRHDHSIDELLGKALKVGEVNLKVMGMLDQGHNDTFGHPEPTQVRVTPVKGKAIVMSGHDLRDLEELLKQTEGTGIKVYTHGEMLPAHGYPQLKKYKHLVGNYGGAWQDQQREFADFPGAIVMNTNCLMKPQKSYMDRIFTCNVVGWPGVKHLTNFDFSAAIEAAQAAPGFTEEVPEKKIIVGFGHHAVLGVADKVIDAVKAGQIRHFFLIGGCDGARPGRNYYTQIAEQVPQDCVIMTLACGKYRFNKMEFGDIGGIPRLLDIGQCNDSYSAIRIALALADAFDTDVNSLPLSLVLSWYEQKAVVILLTLLHLGIRNMRLGPSLPAFVSPAALQVLVDKFNIMPISTPQEDLHAILAG